MQRTAIFVLVVIATLIGYDIWTLCAHGVESTISWVTYSQGRQYPILPFAFGIVCGHLFWPNTPKLPRVP